jgi:hypothetical protein
MLIPNQSIVIQTAVADSYNGDISEITPEVLEVWKRDLSQGTVGMNACKSGMAHQEGL